MNQRTEADLTQKDPKGALSGESSQENAHDNSSRARYRDPSIESSEAGKEEVDKTRATSPWTIMEPIKGRIIEAMILMSLATILSLVSLVSLSFVASGALETGSVPAGLLGFSFVAGFLGFVLRGRSFKVSHLGAFFLEGVLRRRLFDKLGRASMGDVKRMGASAVNRIVNDDVHALHAFVADSTPLYAKCYVSPPLTIIAMFWLSWRMALVALAVLFLGMAVMARNFGSAQTKEITKKYYRAQESVERTVVEFAQAMPVVRTFDSGSASFGRYEKALDAYIDLVKRWYASFGEWQKIAMVLLSPGPTLLALLVAGFIFHQSGDLGMGQWMGSMLIGAGVAESLLPFVALSHLVQYSQMATDRIASVMNLPELPQVDPARAKIPSSNRIEFDHVSFRYPGRGRPAIKDVSFVVEEGCFAALVGDSGAGKSTVANLLTRFHDATEGSIKLGGVDLRDIPGDELLKRISVVFQDNFLFSGTIYENITLGIPDATREDVEMAAKKAMAHDFIMGFEKGYDTPVGERGGLVSGGQKQRITIARAFLQNRPILILDEATAFSDPENEAELMKALAELMKGRTVLMIAHRLSSVADADLALYFRNGELAESGAPRELEKRDGPYKRLMDAYLEASEWKVGASPNAGSKKETGGAS